MKKSLLTIGFFFLSVITSFSQDIIYQKDGTEIRAKVIAITDSAVKYNRFDQPDGPSRVIDKADVFMIIYQDGTREVIATNDGKQHPDVGKSSSVTNTNTADSAVIYVYRPGKFSGWAVVYDIHLNEQKMGAVKNKSKFYYVVRQEGEFEVWAKTEKKVSFPLNIKLGENYYIRCGIDMGFVVGRPDINLVDKVQGELEYAKIKSEKTK